MFDDEDLMTGHGRQIIKPQVVELPFLLWNSQKFYRLRNKSYPELAEKKGRPYNSEDLFYSIADLLEISFSEQDLTKSLFSNHFKPKKRMVINSENILISYDDIKKINN